MQKIQPQLNALRQKYKDNKEKMNKELMELYKRYKINPLGGCLPMLLQIPVFIALYEVLSVAIELRHAPFALWITDLSAKDPYYVTPVLMGASMDTCAYGRLHADSAEDDTHRDGPGTGQDNAHHAHSLYVPLYELPLGPRNLLARKQRPFHRPAVPYLQGQKIAFMLYGD
jgi:hypothetical protein